MKNPWLSMWMSGANAWSGAARGMMAAEAKRNQTAMMTEATRQMAALWFPMLQAPEPATVKRKRRRRN